MSRRLVILFAAVVTLGAAPARAQYDVAASSFLGGAADDDVRGARIQSDGTIVVAARTSALPAGVTASALEGVSASAEGVVLRLAPDGRSVRSATRVAADVHDLAIDDDDRVWVAAGAAGLLALDASASSLRWSATPGHVHRVDVAPDGRAAALVPSNIGGADDTPGAGRVHVYDAAGAEIVVFDGHRNTLDLALHPASETVVLVGWRQANAFDGSTTNPVQIAYLRGVGLDGATKWTGYDWSTDRDSASFINAPENNMADTRGYRVAVGRDGRLFAAFECAGGNHIFRYAPFDVRSRVEIVGGDSFHNFSNTRSEHKTFFGVYDPATGAYQTGQQLVGRLSSGRGNTVRVQRGEITSDESGRVYVAGAAAAGLPLTWTPEGTGDYSGGAYLVVMSADLRTRLFVTRMTPSGGSHALDARQLDGERAAIVLGGDVRANDMGDPQLFVAEPLQDTLGGGRDGFFTVVGAEAGPITPRPDAGIGAAPRDAGAGAPPGEDGSIDGCGCRVGASSARPHAALLVVGAVLLALARRRRSR